MVTMRILYFSWILFGKGVDLRRVLCASLVNGVAPGKGEVID